MNILFITMIFQVQINVGEVVSANNPIETYSIVLTRSTFTVGLPWDRQVMNQWAPRVLYRRWRMTFRQTTANNLLCIDDYPALLA
jgi:hypothetical protein